MWPDRVSNPGPLTYKSGALPTSLCTECQRLIKNSTNNDVSNNKLQLLDRLGRYIDKYWGGGGGRWRLPPVFTSLTLENTLAYIHKCCSSLMICQEMALINSELTARSWNTSNCILTYSCSI